MLALRLQVRAPRHHDPQHRGERRRAGEVADHQAPGTEAGQGEADTDATSHDGVRKLRGRPRAKVDPLLRQGVMGLSEGAQQESRAQHRQQALQCRFVEEARGERRDGRGYERQRGPEDDAPDEHGLGALELFLLLRDHQRLADTEIRKRFEQRDEDERERDQPEVPGHQQPREDRRRSERRGARADERAIRPEHSPERSGGYPVLLSLPSHRCKPARVEISEYHSQTLIRNSDDQAKAWM